MDRTFKSDVNEARSQVRLFMFPGMDHCSGGSGPSNWADQLAALVEWVRTERRRILWWQRTAPPERSTQRAQGLRVPAARGLCWPVRRTELTVELGSGELSFADDRRVHVASSRVEHAREKAGARRPDNNSRVYVLHCFTWARTRTSRSASLVNC